ncbi:hypothetical protein KR084_004155 [Drosophila pseudotakahashii]|nr:hypothetical protein KR084_004155 [Drosophila pseudotakahashii]
MSGKALGFFHDSDSVRWYRGMSPVQTEACDGLLHALRDDMEQGSTFRVRRCVFRLGLYPLAESSQIKDIMAMSQGNDLAFLWFLWELAYKSPQKCRQDSENSESEYYSVNEQLLLSGIAHLDMPTTLRALDALLPPPNQSKKRKSQRKTLTQKSSLAMPQGPGQRYNVLPYFSPQVRPREFIPQSKFQAPESRLRFPEYSQYSDRMHQIPNERSRWFAQYQFDPAKRLVTKLLSEELGRLALEPQKYNSQENNPQCETHRYLEKAVDIRRQEKVHSDLQRCLSQLNVTKGSSRVRRKRILQDIEKNIKCLTNKVGGGSPRPFNPVKSFRKEGGSCGLCKHMSSSTPQNTEKKVDVTMLLGPEEKPKIHLLAHSQDNLVQVMLMQRNASQRCGAGDCEILKVDCALEEQKGMNISPKRKRSRTSNIRKRKARKTIKSTVEEAPHLPTTDFKNLADLIPACSRTLRCLQRTAIRCPEEVTFTNRTLDGFQLDFHKIFDLPTPPDQHLPWEDDVLDLEDKQPVIEKLCIEALRNGESKSVKELQRDKSLPPVLKAAGSCAVNMLRKNVAEVGEHQPVKDKVPYQLIDPDNKLQIENLLKAALQVLRTNPHFVLATFSNAHKMPVLLDWVADRYGKTFSREEMQSLVRSTYRIFDRVFQEERLNRREMFRLKKSLSGLGGGTIRYDSYRNFMCLVGQRKTQYNNRLNDLALEQSRLTWLALRGYSHLGGPIKDTFFAYMPARHLDLKRQHIWKSDDYRDMVKLRLRTRHST